MQVANRIIRVQTCRGMNALQWLLIEPFELEVSNDA